MSTVCNLLWFVVDFTHFLQGYFISIRLLIRLHQIPSSKAVNLRNMARFISWIHKNWSDSHNNNNNNNNNNKASTDVYKKKVVRCYRWINNTSSKISQRFSLNWCARTTITSIPGQSLKNNQHFLDLSQYRECPHNEMVIPGRVSLMPAPPPPPPPPHPPTPPTPPPNPPPPPPQPHNHPHPIPQPPPITPPQLTHRTDIKIHYRIIKYE